MLFELFLVHIKRHSMYVTGALFVHKKRWVCVDGVAMRFGVTVWSGFMEFLFCFCFKMSLSFWNRLNAMLDDIMYLLFDNQFQEIKSRSYCQRSIELLLRNPDIYYILLSYYSSTIWSRLLLIIENENTLKIIYLLYHTLLLVSIDES